MLKTRASKFTATIAMVAAMLTAGGAANAVSTGPQAPTATSVAAAPAGASTQATGDYYYVCQYPNGSSLTLTGGSIGSCQGASYVQEYLDGRLIQSINVTGAGTPATASIQCVLLIASSTTAIVSGVGAAGFALVRIAAADALGYRPCD